MASLRGFVLGAISALYLATAAPAQEGGERALEVPGGILSAGIEVTISYSNSELAGEVIAIEISDGSEGSEFILIELDEDGEGENTWEVPEDWELAYFNAPDAERLIRPVGELN